MRGGVEHRESGFALHLPRDVHEGRARTGHARDGLRQPALVPHLPRDHVHEVAQARVCVELRQRQAVVPRKPAFLEIVAHHPEAHQEVLPDPAAHLFEDFEAKAGAVLEAPAVLVGAPVDQRGPELVDEMPVGEQLGAVEPALLAARRGVTERAHHPPDVVAVHLLGERAVRVLAHHRGRQRRQPVLDVPQGAMPHMGDLAHDRAAVAADTLGELPQHGNDRVVADVDLAERGGRVRRDVGGAAEHGEREAALGLLLVVELVAQLRMLVLDVSGGVARAHEPVLERHVAEPEGLQEMWGTGSGSGPCAWTPVIGCPDHDESGAPGTTGERRTQRGLWSPFLPVWQIEP